jgi:hypothetical protein
MTTKNKRSNTIAQKPQMTTHATCRCLYFDLNHDDYNYSLLLDVDDGTVYCNRSNWMPPSFDPEELTYSTSEEFLVKFEVIGPRVDGKGRPSVQITIIDWRQRKWTDGLAAGMAASTGQTTETREAHLSESREKISFGSLVRRSRSQASEWSAQKDCRW